MNYAAEEILLVFMLVFIKINISEVRVNQFQTMLVDSYRKLATKLLTFIWYWGVGLIVIRVGVFVAGESNIILSSAFSIAAATDTLVASSWRRLSLFITVLLVLLNEYWKRWPQSCTATWGRQVPGHGFNRKVKFYQPTKFQHNLAMSSCRLKIGRYSQPIFSVQSILFHL